METNLERFRLESAEQVALMLVTFNSMKGTNGPTAAQYVKWLNSEAVNGGVWKVLGGQANFAFLRCPFCGKEAVTKRYIGMLDGGGMGPTIPFVLPYCPYCGEKMCKTTLDDSSPDFGFKGFEAKPETEKE